MPDSNGDRVQPGARVKMPDPDLPVSCVVGTIPAPDGTRRLLLVFAMPGMTVAVPLSGEQWDAVRELGDKARTGLGIVLEATGLERTENGGFRTDG